MAANFTIAQGSTLTRSFYIKDKNQVKQDLSSYNFRGDIKDAVGGAVVLSYTITALDINHINIEISAAATAATPVGIYVYDVERFTAADVYVDKVLAGTLTITSEVTT